MTADDFLDLILIRELGLTLEQIAELPEHVRVFGVELLGLE